MHRIAFGFLDAVGSFAGPTACVFAAGGARADEYAVDRHWTAPGMDWYVGCPSGLVACSPRLSFAGENLEKGDGVF